MAAKKDPSWILPRIQIYGENAEIVLYVRGLREKVWN